MIRYYDLTQVISEQMAVWPGDPPVMVERGAVTDAQAGVSRLGLGSHTGTHVDPPAHFFAGRTTVDELPLDILCGPAWVAHLPPRKPIHAADLANAGIAPGTQRLLLRTVNSDRQPAGRTFDPEFIALAPDAAEWLLKKNVRLVGIDAPSIEPFGSLGEPVHRALLGAGVVIVEGLALDTLPPGPCELVCLPLKLAEGDGAPARVIVLRDE